MWHLGKPLQVQWLRRVTFQKAGHKQAQQGMMEFGRDQVTYKPEIMTQQIGTLFIEDYLGAQL